MEDSSAVDLMMRESAETTATLLAQSDKADKDRCYI